VVCDNDDIVELAISAIWKHDTQRNSLVYQKRF